MTLEEAQAAKKAHIAAKLALAPGQRVLDIGCGWGGMAITLAKPADVNVHGIPLSQDQFALAKARAAEAGALKSVVCGQSGSGRVDLGGRLVHKQKKTNNDLVQM